MSSDDCQVYNREYQVSGYDEIGNLVKRRWPNAKLLLQTVKQFIDLDIRVEVNLTPHKPNNLP